MRAPRVRDGRFDDSAHYLMTGVPEAGPASGRARLFAELINQVASPGQVRHLAAAVEPGWPSMAT